MKRFGILCFLFVFCGSLFAAPSRCEFIGDTGQRIYYVEMPEGEGSYPLAILIEGSYDAEHGLRSITRLQAIFSDLLLPLNVGVASMEKFGVDGEISDWETFHRNNTFSRRLVGHIEFVRWLKENPPKEWNGELILIGGSEGGPIAIKLAHAIHPKGCVVMVGCGDQSFKEYIWKLIQTFPSDIQQSLFNEPGDLRELYEKQIALMKANPDPLQFWLGQSYLYWSDGSDLTEKAEFLSLECPVLVIAGSEDVECESTDRLIAEAKQQGQNAVYLRIEGMGHNVLDPRWQVLGHVADFIKDLAVKKI